MHKKIAFFKGSLVLAIVGFAAASGVATAEDRDPIVVESLQATTSVTTHYSTVQREPVEKFSTNVRVGYSDLDLTNNADVAKFQTRIKTAAQLACQKLGHVVPVADLQCIDKTLADLQPQLQSAREAAMHAAAVRAAQDRRPS
jgi:UrcA family protein